MCCPNRRVHSIGNPEYHKKLRDTKLAHLNPMWRGDKVGYQGIHDWIKSRKEKPPLCKICKERTPYDLANKSGEYKRDLEDWEWLCRKCHMEKDGRMLNFSLMSKPRKRGPNKVKGWKRPDVSERNRTNNPNKRRDNHEMRSV